MQVDVLVHGSKASVESQVSEVQKYPGLNKIWTAESDNLENPYGGALSGIAKSLIDSQGYTQVVAASSGFGKDVIPRLGGLLDLQPITDVCEIHDGGAKFVRPIYAGNAMCTVSTIDAIKLLTVRGTNFDKVKQGDAAGYSTEAVAGVDDILGGQQG